ncbi:MAG TPA: hypothetical protein VKG62_08360 [Solirubrobacteraceae bacterium]|nr:hypothetical protein [Solirubrobacteraceae bacterium]
MHSVHRGEALAEFVHEAAGRLHADVQAGAEVGFELDSQAGRRGGGAPALYCYRALTGEFIAEREAELERLPGYAEAARLLGAFDGLDRYLAGAGLDAGRISGSTRVRAAIRVLLSDVFSEQTDFELRPERLADSLQRLEQAALSSAGGVTLLATLRGLAIASGELPLARGLTIARPENLAGLPEGARAIGGTHQADHLITLFTSEEQDPLRAIAHGRAVLRDLLRSLRLFGDGRVTLGALAWTRVGAGGWNPLALGTGGRPHGMLLVAAEQEDELRAFCSLVSRRAPEGNELAWALRRFELGCERESAYEALTDHLLALRALLEPEGPASGLLPGRLAALCATPERRTQLTGRAVQAIALEQAVRAGNAVADAGGERLAREIADHLRALLRDVICGHLHPDLAALADEILLEPPEAREASPEAGSAEQVVGDPGQAEEILDLFI